MILFSSLLLVSAVSAFPSYEKRSVNSTIPIPTRSNDTGLKVIPDNAHPFKAPGENDLRGPCPGLNTLANHGYLPRNGIASLGDIVSAVQEGFNMEYTLATGLASFGMLARGNVLLDKLSIGGPTKEIPALPGSIDGTPGGLGTHGRFEGDMSMTRFDFGLGDNVNFNQVLFDQLLSFVNKHTTNDTVTPTALAEFKVARFNDSMANNPHFDLTDPRFTTSFGEVGFALSFFANSTQGVLTVPVMTSIFQSQRFPDNWHRHATPVNISDVGDAFDPVFANPGETGIDIIVPGKKDANGTFVLDPSSQQECSLYNSITANIPAAIFSDKADPQTRANANALFGFVETLIKGDCPAVTPSAPLG